MGRIQTRNENEEYHEVTVGSEEDELKTTFLITILGAMIKRSGGSIRVTQAEFDAMGEHTNLVIEYADDFNSVSVELKDERKSKAN